MFLLLVSVSACAGEIVTPPIPADRGSVSVVQSAAAATPSAKADVNFAEHFDDPCETLDSEGSCRLVECTFGPKAGYQRTDAGTISITGSLGKLAVPFGDGGYPSITQNGLLFATGDLLDIDLAGSDAMSPLSVTLPIPPPPVVTSALNVGVIDRSVPFGIAWTSNAATGRVQAMLSTQPITPGNSTLTVLCVADLSVGSLEMPPALLSQLTPATKVAPVLKVRFGAYEELDHEGWKVEISSLSEPLNPDGTFVTSHEVSLN